MHPSQLEGLAHDAWFVCLIRDCYVTFIDALIGVDVNESGRWILLT